MEWPLAALNQTAFMLRESLRKIMNLPPVVNSVLQYSLMFAVDAALEPISSESSCGDEDKELKYAVHNGSMAMGICRDLSEGSCWPRSKFPPGSRPLKKENLWVQFTHP
jgi:hypothetical protein